MSLDILIKQYTKKNNIDGVVHEGGRYTFALEKLSIHCSMLGKKLYIESKLCTAPDSITEKEELNRKLAAAIAEATEYQTCLAISPQNEYVIFERHSFDGLSVDTFSTILNKFGAFYLYLKQKLDSF